MTNSFKKLDLELNANSRVKNAGIHDATIVGISTEEVSEFRHDLEIRLRSEDGSKLMLKLEGVEHFELAFFGHQNVVGDLYVYQNCDALSEIMTIVNLETFTHHSYAGLNERVKSGKLALVKIDAAVGADILIVCERAGLFDTSPQELAEK